MDTPKNVNGSTLSTTQKPQQTGEGTSPPTVGGATATMGSDNNNAQHRQISPSSIGASSIQPVVLERTKSSTTVSVQRGIIPDPTKEDARLRREFEKFWGAIIPTERSFLLTVVNKFKLSPDKMAQFNEQALVVVIKNTNDQSDKILHFKRPLEWGIFELTKEHFHRYLLSICLKYPNNTNIKLKQTLLQYREWYREQSQRVGRVQAPKDALTLKAEWEIADQFLEYLGQLTPEDILVSPSSVERFLKDQVVGVVNSVLNRYYFIIQQIENSSDHPPQIEFDPTQSTEPIVTEPVEKPNTASNIHTSKVIITDVTDVSEDAVKAETVVTEAVDSISAIYDTDTIKFESSSRHSFRTMKQWNEHIASLIGKITDFSEAEDIIQVFLEKLNTPSQFPKEVANDISNTLLWIKERCTNRDQESPSLTLEVIKDVLKGTLSRMVRETFKIGTERVGREIYDMNYKLERYFSRNQVQEKLTGGDLERLESILNTKKTEELFSFNTELRCKTENADLTFRRVGEILKEIDKFYEECTAEIDKALKQATTKSQATTESEAQAATTEPQLATEPPPAANSEQ